MPFNFHLDTNYLIANLQYSNSYQSISRTDRDQAEQAHGAVGHLKSRDYSILASTFVIGEAMKVISKKPTISNPNDLVLNFRQNIQSGDILPCSVEKQRLGRFTDLVNKLKKIDQYIESGDVLAIACSLEDKNCRGLLTFEEKLINSTGLQKFVNEHKSRKFVITDYPVHI